MLSSWWSKIFCRVTTAKNDCVFEVFEGREVAVRTLRSSTWRAGYHEKYLKKVAQLIHLFAEGFNPNLHVYLMLLEMN